MKVYKSKLGIGIALFVILLVGSILIVSVVDKHWISVALNLIIVSLFILLYRSTYYTINDKKLNIKSAFIINETIEIKSIISISETHNPLSAPAFSLDRLELSYNKSNSILISPKKKKEFISHLKSINKNIIINYRK